MKMSFYLKTKAFSFVRSIIAAMRDELGLDVTRGAIDRKIAAIRANHSKTEPKLPPTDRFVFTQRFFLMLTYFPSIELVMRDSRSKIRKEYYGFRDIYTGERIYLKMDCDSVVVVRDSPAGFMIGKRYLIESLNRTRAGLTWEKVFKWMRRELKAKGIKLKVYDVDKFIRLNEKRAKLSQIMIDKCKETRRAFYNDYGQTKK